MNRTILARAAVCILFAGTLSMAATGTGSAATSELNLNYSCAFALIGAQDVPVKITAENLPDSAVTGQPTPEVKVTAVATVPEQATGGLNFFGAATVEGTATTRTRVDNAGAVAELAPALAIPPTPVPASGTFNVTASGVIAPMTFTNPGATKMFLGDVEITLTPRRADGSETGLGTFTTPCTLKPDQNALLHQLEVAPAAAAQAVQIAYTVNGTTTVKKQDAAMALGPGTLTASVDLAAGTYTADLALPRSAGTFKLFGVLPATATVEFIAAGKTTGTIKDGRVTSNSKVTIRLVDVQMSGRSMLKDTDRCATTSPADIALTSESGFNPAVGGTLAGTYTIPEFAGCGLITGIVNATVPGPDNTLKLDLAIRK